ncbi:hypothetical protein MN032_11755 [Agromyces atrinae]|uniref:Uncharacterized protein n=1 Tax=Agromyces atrinae TaxID=592376 RepID=A0A4Q2M3W6_9MICO|nr:hypothetical protein [Agromyces atrinae]MCI2958369.1 hypothetical protein [Agromyces atrinae]NYD66417.1 hypothetical protein [Agromyces atrinae]RXZ86725.1 hypothetical protein ESP50_10130 [Agromyces atrinae]
MSDIPDDRAENELVSRMRLIEDQPLEARAASYTQVYDELRAALEDADPARTDARTPGPGRSV